MAAGASGGKFHVRLALFKNAYHGKIALDAADGIGDDRAAFVADHIEADAAPLQFLHDAGSAGAAPLLRAGGCKIYVTLRLIALSQKFLRRLKEGHERGLGVRRAAPPDLALSQIAGEGLMEPGPLRGNHVLMAQKQDGITAVLALPIKEQTALQLRKLQLFKDQRKQLPQHLMEAPVLFRFLQIRVGGGVIPHHGAQLFTVGDRPLLRGRRDVAGSFRTHKRRPDHRDQQQAQNEGQNDPQNDHASSPAFFFRKCRKAIAMASAPLGMIIKLVEPVREGTSTNSTLITTRGAAAMCILPRKYL